MSAIRPELFQSAVKFLKDSRVKSKPLQKRIEFLEYKGLTPDEIEEALKAANDGDITNDFNDLQGMFNEIFISERMTFTKLPPPIPRFDWKDYFIAATLISGIGYAIADIAKEYIVSFLGTLTTDGLEHDKQSFSNQLTTTTEILDVMKFDTQIIKKSIKEQSFEVKKILEMLDNVLSDLKYYEGKKDIELETLKEDMDSIRDLIPKLFKESEDCQEQSFINLKRELKLLKSLASRKGSQIFKSFDSPLSIITNMIPTNSGANSGSPSTPEIKIFKSLDSPLSIITNMIPKNSGSNSGSPSTPEIKMGTNNIYTITKVSNKQIL
ncbi:peroxisomal membrane anchor protein conserved region-domain-containing protein [Gigaspora rosea]|uniref:Peroxisomal membrane protein PEX14 n=1 Tax=Gigaspora rosea TaxID=44941 RepID=A0A397VWR5_9GLOM|nr:peroxisomal membrane anchor protein conserved region-domain-containing protein [Gigaspora rosea]